MLRLAEIVKTFERLLRPRTSPEHQVRGIESLVAKLLAAREKKADLSALAKRAYGIAWKNVHGHGVPVNTILKPTRERIMADRRIKTALQKLDTMGREIHAFAQGSGGTLRLDRTSMPLNAMEAATAAACARADGESHDDDDFDVLAMSFDGGSKPNAMQLATEHALAAAI